MTSQNYLFNYLYSSIGQRQLKSKITGSAQGGLNQENLKSIPIPLPPMEIQRAIVEECAVVDAEYETSRMSIEEYRSKISKVFVDLEVLAGGG